MGYLKINPCDIALPTRVARRANAETEANGHSPGGEDITLRKQRFARLKPRTKDHLSGAERHALARIAQRFAPDAQSVISPGDQRFANRLPQTPLALASSSGIRTLIVVLIVIALLPSLTLAAMFWLGAVNTPWSTPLGAENNVGAWPAVKLAVGMAAPERIELKQTAEIQPVALTAPAKLDVIAGRDITFAIALDRPDALPGRSIIAIGGLPQGAKLSSGRPYGETEWNLRSDEIGDLHLVLPNTAIGETKLRVKLVAPDGEIIASTETFLKVTADPDPALVLRPQDSERLPEARDPSEVHMLAPGDIYDLTFISIGAWDDQTQPLLGATGVEERFTNLEALTATSGDSAQSLPTRSAKNANDGIHAKWIKPLAFVNLREGPSSSAAVISVVAKGTRLPLIKRKRAWVQVTNPATSEGGWIYAGNVATVTKSRRGRERAAHSESPPASDTLWSGLGQWLTSR